MSWLEVPLGLALVAYIAYLRRARGQALSRAALETQARQVLLARQARQEAESALRDRALAMVIHDLRTPITSAKINADLIVRARPEATRAGITP